MMFTLFLLTLLVSTIHCGPEEQEGVKYADACEVCRVVATEMEAKLEETGKTSEVLEIGYSVDDVAPKKRKQYAKSELRLIESLENVCDAILKYNIHKERNDHTRFAKGMSQTFKTLHALVDKGVKVDLGMPYELWDKPSAEVTNLKTQCEQLLEDYEAEIEDWYYNHQGQVPLTKYLCIDKALKGGDVSCLKDKGDTGSIDGPKEAENSKRPTQDEL